MWFWVAMRIVTIIAVVKNCCFSNNKWPKQTEIIKIVVNNFISIIIYIISYSPRIVFILCKQSIILLIIVQPKCLKQFVKNFESPDSNVLCLLAWYVSRQCCFGIYDDWQGRLLLLLFVNFFLNGAWSCWDGKPPPSSLKALLSLGGVNFKACLRWSDVKFSNPEQINGL